MLKLKAGCFQARPGDHRGRKVQAEDVVDELDSSAGAAEPEA